MVAGMVNCNECQSWISIEQVYTHSCVNHAIKIAEKLNYIHSLFQELEGQGIELPMGDYGLIYDIIEDIRYDFEIERIFSGNPEGK